MIQGLRNHPISFGLRWLVAVVLALALPVQVTAATQVSRPGRGDRIIISGAAGNLGELTVADCAEAAAAVLSTPGHDDKVYNITGPNLVDTRDLAAAMSAATGKAINLAINLGLAPTNPGFGKALSVVSHDVAELTGKPPMTLTSFLRQHEAEIVHPNRQ
jgi:nucleoside-diphosphate-sugar epimerase